MRKNVNYRRRCRWVLLTVAVLSGLNMVLLWQNFGFRMYFSAAVPYYTGLLGRALGADGVLTALLAAVALLWCLLYPACLPTPAYGLWFYALDTVVLLAAAVFWVQNPMSCLPELWAHGLVLVLLTPPVNFRQSG